MRGMLLAAGLGTRLLPLTSARPKPAVPFRLRTLGGESLRGLARHGVLDVVVNAHPFAEALERVLRKDAPREMSLRFSIEERVLGTGGGIRRAYGESEEDVLVTNGDILYAPDLARLIAAHRESRALATLLVRPVDGSAPGTIDVDAEGCVRAILSPEAPAQGTSRYAFTGIHILSPEALSHLPEEGCVVRKGYVPWLGRGARIEAVIDDAPFADLGTPRAYLEAHFDLGHADEPRIASSAELDPRAQVYESYLGEGARITRDTRLTRSIVWPGVTVPPGEYENVIFWEGGALKP